MTRTDTPGSTPDDQSPGTDPVEQPAPEVPEAPEVPPAPLLQLSAPLPWVTDTDVDLAEIAARLASGHGPIAIDAERASGYRYSPRAYLIQLRREGSGTALVDPIGLNDLAPLRAALTDVEWIFHAASQDLPCLAELDLRPSALFDTELAGRLLGYPRVGLATMVEEVLGFRLRKEHSAVDWSTRPLPTPWLEYAALDVEALAELREALHGELLATQKWEWARQEFEHLLTLAPPPPRAEPWRRTSGLHRARGRRALAAVRALWQARDQIASERDVTPGRIIPDSAIMEVALANPRDRTTLLGLRGFHGRGARRYVKNWLDALHEARLLPDTSLPEVSARHDGPPPPRSWADKNPAAATRLSQARTSLSQLAVELNLPVENVLTPDSARRVLWHPPGDDERAVASALQALGARSWQIELASPILTQAIVDHPDGTGTPAAQPPQADPAD